ncbi:hypothetical protein JTE90_010888 [Oedothorax gibbosus]|uniref:Caveolin n=1 Tax=Oedothorax gibbosus TaxID=931172 RepID=A0AAV6UID8_9ARAC|nr:hypothetical protein JTE90_010888 [Oedothorax gibbosus]
MDVVNRDPNNLNEYLQQLRDDLRMVDVPLKQQQKRIESPPPPSPALASYLTTVDFDDVIAEPSGVPGCVWRNSKHVFTHSRNCCYKCLTVMCGLPVALIVGCSFACGAFAHMWCKCFRKPKLNKIRQIS